MDSGCADGENSGRCSLDHVDDEEGSGPFNGIVRFNEGPLLKLLNLLHQNEANRRSKSTQNQETDRGKL
jgi:hypothetical protein